MKTIDTRYKLWIHLIMKKKVSVTLIIIVAVFLVVPIAFWLLYSGKNSDDVKGAKTGAPGLIVKVISKNGSWDMFKYLCEDEEQCVESLDSGKFLDKTSGGGGEEQSITIRYSSDWQSYKFLKIYVGGGWNSSDRLFNVSVKDNIDGAYIKDFSFGGKTYRAAIIPVDNLNSGFFNDAVVFSDIE